LENFLRKVLIWISCKQNWERWQYDKASMKWTTSQCAHWWRWFCQWIDLESERCTRVTEPHVKFHERQEFITLWYNVLFVSIWRSNASGSIVRKNSLLQTVHCTELTHKICYVVSQHPLYGCHILIDGLAWKLVDDIMNTWSDRIFLCFAFISNSVTNFKVGFCCLMCMSTVVLLGVFSAWIKLNTTHQYKIWNTCFVANFLCYNTAKYF